MGVVTANFLSVNALFGVEVLPPKKAQIAGILIPVFLQVSQFTGQFFVNFEMQLVVKYSQ